MNLYIIKIDEYLYEINSKDNYEYIKNDCLKNILNNNNDKEINSSIKYKISFLVNNKNDITISITNRHYIISLLNTINEINLINHMNKFTIN